jgi:hypothetical protein
MADRDLEVSALEKALLSDPSDATVRFRLAYAYGEQENYPLALYHYKIRLTQGPDPAALNNVGVAYDALKLQGKEIESFLAAAPENDLAQGNVSYAYLDRGFFSTAEEIASAVLAKGKLEPVVRDRAAAVLQRISARRDEEKEKEEKILRDARGEAEFRALYAEAYVGDAAQPVAGQFDTPHGQLAIRQDGERITGTATRRETLPRTLLAGLLPGGATREQTRVLTLEGRVHQRAGTFTLKTEVTPDGGLSIPERSEVKGLFVIALDGRSLEVLERGKEASRNYTARLVALNLEI